VGARPRRQGQGDARPHRPARWPRRGPRDQRSGHPAPGRAVGSPPGAVRIRFGAAACLAESDGAAIPGSWPSCRATLGPLPPSDMI
jgi:hypothetical protein